MPEPHHGGAHSALELEAKELGVVLKHMRYVAWPDVHALEVLDHGGEVDDDASMEHLWVVAKQVRERVLADPELAEVVKDKDNVLTDTASKNEQVHGEVFIG
ncbi:hypothetical protein ABZP36_035625 [Zizania latifolia]